MKQEAEIRSLSVGPTDNNVYVLVCPETRESVIVDAADEADRILSEAAGTDVRYTLQSLGHRDHVQALEIVKAALGAPVGAHPGDAGMLPVPPDLLLQDGQRLRFGKEARSRRRSPPRA